MQLLPLSHSTVYVAPDAEEIELLPPLYKPSEIDILCERGKLFARHPGNVRFSEAIRSNLEIYVAARKRVEKGLVIANIKFSLREGGARFVKLDIKSKRYYEISEDEVHVKIGHAIYYDMIKLRTQSKKNPSRMVAADIIKLRKPSKNPSKMVVAASRTYSHGVVHLSKESDLDSTTVMVGRGPARYPETDMLTLGKGPLINSHGVVGLSKESDSDSTTVMLGRGRGNGPLIRSLARSRNIFRSPAAW
jgi:hypothetical protein